MYVSSHVAMTQLLLTYSYVPVSSGIMGVLRPMRFRRWIEVLAVFSVLLHAGFLIHHNTSVLQTSVSDAFAFEARAFCYVGSSDSQPKLPAPDNTTKCPICAGAAPTVATLDIGIPAIEAPSISAPTLAFMPEIIVGTIPSVCPPSRAPPSFA